MKHSVYVATTILYGILGVVGIGGAIVSGVIQQYFILGLSLIFSYVAFDNFFCGTHARSCGYRAEGHYVIPPFLHNIVLVDGRKVRKDDNGRK
jgi:hypothetical protein